MTPATVNLERERLLELAAEYRDKGYEVLFQPGSEDVPDFLKNYRPNMIARRDGEAVVIEVKSRSSLNSSSNQYLRNLAQLVAQHPGWRFEFVMTNPEEITSPQAEGSLQEHEIKSGLQVARQLTAEHPESAILYVWSLVEATLRLVAERERISLPRVDPLYLIKQFATEGIISRAEYRLLMNAFSLRSAIAHGFKATGITQDSVYELIGMAEQLLRVLNSTETD